MFKMEQTLIIRPSTIRQELDPRGIEDDEQ